MVSGLCRVLASMYQNETECYAGYDRTTFGTPD
jgi:hypothetical protein